MNAGHYEQVSACFDHTLRELVFHDNDICTIPLAQRVHAWEEVYGTARARRKYNRISNILYADLPALLPAVGLTFTDVLSRCRATSWPSLEIQKFSVLTKKAEIHDLCTLAEIAAGLRPSFWDALKEVNHRPSERVRVYKVLAGRGSRKEEFARKYSEILGDRHPLPPSNVSRSFPTERLADLADAYELPYQWVFGGYGEIPISRMRPARQQLVDSYMLLDPTGRRILETMLQARIHGTESKTDRVEVPVRGTRIQNAGAAPICQWDPNRSDTSTDPETGLIRNPFAPVLHEISGLGSQQERNAAFISFTDDILEQCRKRMLAVVREKDIRPYQLAEALQISRASATRILNGERTMNSDSIAIFCHEFANMSCDEFLLGIKSSGIMIPQELNSALKFCFARTGKNAERRISSILREQYEPILSETSPPWNLTPEESLGRLRALYENTPMGSWGQIRKNGEWTKSLYKCLSVKEKDLEAGPMRIRRLILNRIRFNVPADYFVLRDYTSSSILYWNRGERTEEAGAVIRNVTKCYLLLSEEQQRCLLRELLEQTK